MIGRRGFIGGLIGLVAAPALASITAHATAPIAVKAARPLWAVTYDFHTGYHWVSNRTGRTALVKINRDKVFLGDLIPENEFEVQTYEVS